MLCALFWTQHFKLCVCHDLMFVVVLHHMCLARGVASGCRLLMDDISSMRMQQVSVLKQACPRSTGGFVHGLGLGFALSPCSWAACMLRYTTCG